MVEGILVKIGDLVNRETRKYAIISLMKNITPFILLAAIPAFAYEGPFQEFAMWRGEETIVRLNDNLEGELNAIPTNDEVKVEYKTFAPIPYTTPSMGSQIAFRYDRHLDPKSCGCCDDLGPAYLKISVPENARPGVHDLGPVHVRVVDRMLPKPTDWKFLLDLWQHPWAVSRYFHTEPFSAEHYQNMESVWKTLAWCGVKPITATLVDLPWNHQCYDAYHSMIRHVRHDDGSWSRDFSRFDEYVAFAKKCGLGPRIDCYTMCPWGYVVRWENDKGEIQRGEAKPGSELFKEFWGSFLPEFAKHLKDKGWFENTYIAMDERAPEDMKIISEFIREKASGLKIQTAGNQNPANFKGIVIDSFCLGLDHFTPDFLKEIESRRAAGLVTTFYVCCGPARPNTFMTSSDDEAYWLGAFPAMKNLDGFLRWAANSWPRDPESDAAFGWWAPGDTFLVYPDGSPSARLVHLRAGVVAAEKWRILSEQKLFEKERGELAAKYGDYDKAMKGELDLHRCREELTSLVNRD